MVVDTLGRRAVGRLRLARKKRVRGWPVSISFSAATVGKKPQRGQSPRGQLVLVSD
jgi:hypothetical protein